MNPETKAAYRELLHVAMLDIRAKCQPHHRVSRNPITWYRQYQRSRVAGAVADWLHNLAQHSSLDFEHFDERRFWNDHAIYCKAFPGNYLERYRKEFDDHLLRCRLDQRERPDE